MKDEWRFTITVHGEQFVMMIGIKKMLLLFADSLVFKVICLRVLSVVLNLAKGLDIFGLTMLIVQVMSHPYFHAAIGKWEDTTVTTIKTRGYAALTVRFRQYIPDVYNLVIV
jgi:hypothetical protein